MHTKPQQQETCPVCGNLIDNGRETVLNECCSGQWIKRQIDSCYA
ncbi:MAG: hypothetical protein M0Z65_07545 [Firmicutes bacterium]|uniref:Uncharacterized protein n=1 Tax=Melghirimyces thermohalophilus TaxID=1236220 RepID=A0A1G6N369_9BACL|nr:hypothetical protein [Melghirimyces thermohalophilus]MDA8353028.1 hypothetical protein [Bacillota bacterium]SDC61575.1 hypothetical protein SAMN04488112_11193 [Melghirimyces thermohalophilus]